MPSVAFHLFLSLNPDILHCIVQCRKDTFVYFKSCSCDFRLPPVWIHGPFPAWKKIRKHSSCGSGSHRILRIRNQRMVPSRNNKPRSKMAPDHGRLYVYMLQTIESVHRCGASGSMRACRAAGPGSIPGLYKFPG